MTCHIENQIADHCNQEPKDICYQCDELITEDDASIEALTKHDGYKFIHIDCVDEFIAD